MSSIEEIMRHEDLRCTENIIEFLKKVLRNKTNIVDLLLEEIKYNFFVRTFNGKCNQAA